MIRSCLQFVRRCGCVEIYDTSKKKKLNSPWGEASSCGMYVTVHTPYFPDGKHAIQNDG